MIGNPLLLGDEGYQIQRSLRFRSGASAYLNRTPASASNRRTWTWSCWVKRGNLGLRNALFGAGTANPNPGGTAFYFNSTTGVLELIVGGGNAMILSTSAVYRDPSAWYHLLVAVDTTQATSSNRAKLYINGVQVTAFGTATYPSQNVEFDVNSTALHAVGSRTDDGAPPVSTFDGYMAEVNFIDGQALTPSSFGAINPVTGVWSATKYAGTYGTNGFYLNFTDNSAATATTIGKDYSGNGNNWTPNNISVTAGVTYDSMLDAPLGTGGGERGNYATWNPIVNIGNAIFSNGNLTATNGTSGASTCTMPVYLGKYYAEFSPSVLGSTNARLIGIFAYSAGDSLAQYIAKCVAYQPDGTKRINSTTSSYGASYTTADVIGVSLDLDNNTIEFFKNNTSQGVIDTTLSQPTGTLWTFGSAQGGAVSSSVVANFGQRPFSYTPPTGFKALHTGNLAAPVIALPAQNMAATLYTGTGVARSVSNAVNGVSFQPDWVWIKSRNAAQTHGLFDSNRGVQKLLQSNSTAAELTSSAYLTAFDSGGFSLGTTQFLNGSGDTFVGWQWKAGGTAVTNTAGSITSSVSANVSAGFSVVTWAGNSTNAATIGHGLGVAPSILITKSRSNATSWIFGIGGISGFGVNDYLTLQTTDAKGTSSTFYQAYGSSTFTTGVSAANEMNKTGNNYVTYCFTPVAGYSAFGTYTGNGSTDGPFVYLGFRPRWVLVKRTDTAGFGWHLLDSSRNEFNVVGKVLIPNSSAAESDDPSNYGTDFLSNGFKSRTSATGMNASGGTYIYAAFAENPFKNSLAR